MRYLEKLKLIITLGWRNIWRQKRRSLLVISTAMVGIMGVMLTMGLMNGMIKMWVDSSVESGIGHVQIRPAGFNKSRKNSMHFKDPRPLRQLVEKAMNESSDHWKHGALHYGNRFERKGFIRLGSAMQGLLVIGIDPDREKAISKYDEWLIDGNYLNSKEEDIPGVIPCLIGVANAKKLDVGVNDYIVLTIGGADGSSKSVRARISGIFKSIAEPVDKYNMVVRRVDLSKVYGSQEAELSYTVFRAENRFLAGNLKNYLNDVSGAERPLKNRSFEILTFEDMQPGITYILSMIDSFMEIFILIFMFGFAFVLLNSILMSVFERTREIGIVRAMGSPGDVIMLTVIVESVLLGLIGAIAGILASAIIILPLNKVGMSFTMFARGMERMGGSGTLFYPSMNLDDIVSGITVVFVMSFVSAIYPAWKAIRMTPVNAIYHR